MLTSLDDAARNGLQSILAQIGPLRVQLAVPPPVLVLEQSPRIEYQTRIHLLCHALQAAESATRAGAACALAMMGCNARNAIHSLVNALDDRHALVRAAATIALGSLGSHGAPAVPALLELMHSSEELQATAAIALGRIGPGAIDALSALEQLSESRDPFLRWCGESATTAIAGSLAVAV